MCLPLTPFASPDHKVTNLSGDIAGGLSQVKTPADHEKQLKSSQELTPAPLRVRQEDCCKFKGNLG